MRLRREEVLTGSDKSTAARKKASSKKIAAAGKAAADSKKKTTAKKAAGKKIASTAASETDAASKVIEQNTRPVAEKAKGAKTNTTSNKTTATKQKVAKSTVKQVESESTKQVDAPDSDLEDDLDNFELPTGGSKAPVPYERNDGHYMDAEQLDHFSVKLAEWKQQLMEEVDRTVGHMKDDATNFPDPNDRATQEEEFSLELRTRDRERKLIKKINEAQKRIDDDEYGYCETCGIEIGVSRLEARPTAELCIDCKTLEEIRERQTA